MTDSCTGDTERTLEEKIRDALVIDEPDENELVRALEGAIRITERHHRILPDDGLDERKPRDQVMTWLLAKYAANRVSDGEAPLEASIAELRDHFDRELVREVADHGWVRVREGYLSVRPSFNQPLADELAARYGGERDGE